MSTPDEDGGGRDDDGDGGDAVAARLQRRVAGPVGLVDAAAPGRVAIARAGWGAQRFAVARALAARLHAADGATDADPLPLARALGPAGAPADEESAGDVAAAPAPAAATGAVPAAAAARAVPAAAVTAAAAAGGVAAAAAGEPRAAGGASAHATLAPHAARLVARLSAPGIADLPMVARLQARASFAAGPHAGASLPAIARAVSALARQGEAAAATPGSLPLARALAGATAASDAAPALGAAPAAAAAPEIQAARAAGDHAPPTATGLRAGPSAPSGALAGASRAVVALAASPPVATTAAAATREVPGASQTLAADRARPGAARGGQTISSVLPFVSPVSAAGARPVLARSASRAAAPEITAPHSPADADPIEDRPGRTDAAPGPASVSELSPSTLPLARAIAAAGARAPGSAAGAEAIRDHSPEPAAAAEPAAAEPAATAHGPPRLASAAPGGGAGRPLAVAPEITAAPTAGAAWPLLWRRAAGGRAGDAATSPASRLRAPAAPAAPSLGSGPAAAATAIMRAPTSASAGGAGAHGGDGMEGGASWSATGEDRGGSGAEAPAGGRARQPSVGQIADQVSRLIARRIEVERERRGAKRWT